MKNDKLIRKPSSVANKRWAAYAAAGVATALASTNSAEAVIHYSGPLDLRFHEGGRSFSLDQPSDFFRLSIYLNSYNEGLGHFKISGVATAAFRGFPANHYYYASKLRFGQRVSTGSFTQPPPLDFIGGILIGDAFGIGDRYGQFGSPGPGFIGFRFNNGAGIQYGWARVKMPQHFTEELPFELSDYAYADPGEPITAGQRSSDEKAPDQGSLGWLALGASGLLAWRKSRSRLALSS